MEKQPANGKKVLIVEDDVFLSTVLQDKFKHEGFSVTAAHNGKEGLESALANHPDIILLDIIMPVMDGMTVIRKLREDEWGKTAPVIMLTNLNATDSLVIEKVPLDFPFFLTKSDWAIDDVVRAVKIALGIL